MIEKQEVTQKAFRDMAGFTAFSELTEMDVEVTIHTFLWQGLVTHCLGGPVREETHFLKMALGTLHNLVFAFQGETAAHMFESRGAEAVDGVAGGTVFSELSLMRILLMAVLTVTEWNSQELVI